MLPVTSKDEYDTEPINLNLNSASSETSSFSRTHDIPHILWNLRFRYRINNSPPLVPVWCQINSAHANPFYSFEIHCNTVLPSPHRSSKQNIAFGFPHQNLVCTSLRPQLWHMHKSWCATLCSFVQPAVTSSLLRPNIFFNTLSTKTLSLCSCRHVRDHISHPHDQRTEYFNF